jgi:hypothetical protein
MTIQRKLRKLEVSAVGKCLMRNLELRVTGHRSPLSKATTLLHHVLTPRKFPCADIFDAILSTRSSFPGPELGLAPHPNLTSGVRLEQRR